MKKFIFTALLFSAFSTIEAKNIAENEIETCSTAKDLPCTRMWVADMENLMEDYCATYEQALVIADRNFDACLDDMYGN